MNGVCTYMSASLEGIATLILKILLPILKKEWNISSA